MTDSIETPGAAVPGAPLLTPEWRRVRVHLGDLALDAAVDATNKAWYERASVLTAIAQAHYAAANVRGPAYRGSLSGTNTPQRSGGM